MCQSDRSALRTGLIATLGAVIFAALAIGAATAACASAAAGHALALHYCVKCHGVDGKGDGPAVAAEHISPPPGDWTDKEDMTEHPDVFLRNIIEQGGKAMDKSERMPAFGKKLTPAQVNDLIAYIRTFSR